MINDADVLTSSITHDVRLCDNCDVKFIIPIATQCQLLEIHVTSLRNFVLGEQCRRGQGAADCTDLVDSASGSITYDPPNIKYLVT